VERLGPLDAAFFHLETPSTPQHIGGVALLDPSTCPGGRLPLEALLALVGSRLHLAPRLRQRVAFPPLPLARPVWVDDPRFDLARHVRRAALPPPRGRPELEGFVEEVMSRPLDRARPLWDLHLVEEVEGGRAALVARVHHAVVDGLAALGLAGTVLGFGEPESGPWPGPEPGPGNPEAGPWPGPDSGPWEPEAWPSGARLLAAAAREAAAEPFRSLARLAGRAVRDPARAAEEGRAVLRGLGELATRGVLAPAGPFNRPVGRDRRWTTFEAPVRTFREVREALGGTVNDVVLAVVAGALHRLLRARGEPTRGRSVRALVPVAVREEGPPVGNRVSALLVDLPVGPMAPGRRLRLVREQTRRLKASGQAAGLRFLMELGARLPPPLQALAARVAARGRFVNLAVSNVPGPEAPLRVAGARLLALYPFLPVADRMGLSVGCTSLAGTMAFGITSGPELLSDAEVLVAGLAEALEELARAAGATSRRAPPGSA
jgi:diacylglycerol O-acyltransferase